MDRILILGAKGALGGQLRALYPAAVAWDREEADVTDFQRLQQKVLELDPSHPQAGAVRYWLAANGH